MPPWAWALTAICLLVAAVIVAVCLAACITSSQITQDEERWRDD